MSRKKKMRDKGLQEKKSVNKARKRKMTLDSESVDNQIGFWSVIQLSLRELKKTIEEDLAGYQHLANYLQPNPRSAFLYSVLREIERTQHYEILNLTMAGQISEDDYDNVTSRNLQEVLEDFLKPQIRKIKEFFVRLCLFGTTNSDIYYRHYMMLDYLSRVRYVSKDYRLYYEIQIENHNHVMKSIKDMVRDLEPKLENDKLWYTEVTEIENVKDGSPLLLSEARLISAGIEQMSRYERVVFGTTYAESYSSISESVHANILSTYYAMTQDYLSAIRSLAGVLCVCAIRRIYEILGKPELPHTKALCQIDEDDLIEESQYKSHVARDIELKEFVVVQGLLGQITERRISKYGYVAYKVQFLLESPIEGIHEDWYPSHMLRSFRQLRRESIKENVKKKVSQYTDEVTDEAIERALINTVKELWVKFLRDYLIKSRQM